MTRRQAEATEVERDRLREALAWAVGFIRCNHQNAYEEYEDMRNAAALVGGPPGAFGEFFRLSCRAEVAEAVAEAAVTSLGLKKDHATPTDVKEVIAGLQAEAELYRRGYAYIRAADISNYLAMCEVAGQLGEQALLVAEQLFDLGASEGMRFQKEEAQHEQT